MRKETKIDHIRTIDVSSDGDLGKRIQRMYEEGKRYEDMFCEMTGAVRAPADMERKHVDCWLKDWGVDVKGKKKSTEEGRILVEFHNVSGGIGWCHLKSGCDKIAFWRDKTQYFMLVDKRKLRSVSLRALYHHNGGTLPDVDRSGDYSKMFRLYGRQGRKDSFMFIPLVTMWRSGAIDRIYRYGG